MIDNNYFEIIDQAGYLVGVANANKSVIMVEIKKGKHGPTDKEYYMIEINILTKEELGKRYEITALVVGIYRRAETAKKEMNRFKRHIRRRPRDRTGTIKRFTFAEEKIPVHATEIANIMFV